MTDLTNALNRIFVWIEKIVLALHQVFNQVYHLKR